MYAPVIVRRSLEERPGQDCYQNVWMRSAGSIAARAALHEVLSSFPLGSETIQDIHYRLTNSELGKPYIQRGLRGIAISMSHCKGLAVASAMPGVVSIGIDVEPIEELNGHYLEHFLDRGEIALLRKQMQKEHIGKYAWTVKEAYLKMRGIGLLKSMHKVKIITFGRSNTLQCELWDQDTQSMTHVTSEVHDTHVVSYCVGARG